MAGARNTYGLTPIGKVIAHGWVEVDGCWVFKGPKTDRGYGKVGHAGQTMSAHRIMFESTHGEICDGRLVRHTCDNPPCVNPLHLVPGTDQDNSDDKVARGRHLSRSSHPRAKLSESDIPKIRSLIAAGNHTQREIGRMFGVSPGTISQIKTGRGWA